MQMQTTSLYIQDYAVPNSMISARRPIELTFKTQDVKEGTIFL